MIRVFTAFIGYDSQCLALDRLKRDFPTFDYELVGWAEIDKYAIKAHNALYPQWADRNYGDISKIDWDEVPDFDLFTYSSPCQDFSNAGLQRGGEEGSGTRSSLLWECRRAIIAKKPKYLLLENVAALVSQKFLPLFNKWQAELESYGYSNFARVLNAKDYGVPQNRERVFLVSIRDVDARYSFPPTMPLGKRLKDVLEQDVDEKYYLSDLSINRMQRNMGKEDISIDTDGCAVAITTGFHPSIAEAQVMTPKRTDFGKQVRKQCESCKLDMSRHDMTKLEPRTDGVSNTLTSVQKDNLVAEPLRIPQATKQGYIEVPQGAVFDMSYPESTTRRGRVQEAGQVSPTLMAGGEAPCYYEGKCEPLNADDEGLCRTIKRQYQNSSRANFNRKGSMAATGVINNATYRIRKLTPRECFRLMGVEDKDIDTIQASGVSNSQQYKMAGNSIVVDCLYHLFRKMFTETHSEDKQLTLF